jgi:hypothetical protein
MMRTKSGCEQNPAFDRTPGMELLTGPRNSRVGLGIGDRRLGGVLEIPPYQNITRTSDLPIGNFSYFSNY